MLEKGYYASRLLTLFQIHLILLTLMPLHWLPEYHLNTYTKYPIFFLLSNFFLHQLFYFYLLFNFLFEFSLYASAGFNTITFCYKLYKEVEYNFQVTLSIINTGLVILPTVFFVHKKSRKTETFFVSYFANQLLAQSIVFDHVKI